MWPHLLSACNLCSYSGFFLVLPGFLVCHVYPSISTYTLLVLCAVLFEKKSRYRKCKPFEKITKLLEK